jgi:hypothetical protein
MARLDPKKAGKQMKSTPKGKTTSNKPAKASKKSMAPMDLETESATEANNRALWHTYRELQERVDHALEQLRTHFEEGAAPFVLLQDEKHLLLLLGECNYMAHTFMDLMGSEQRIR